MTPELDILGTSGLKQFGGIINEEFLIRLKYPRGVQAYREMIDNCAVIGAIRFLIRALVRQVEWRIEPANDDNDSIEVAAFTESCLEDMEITFDNLISEVLSSLDYGWALFEKIYKLRKGDTDDPTTRSKYDDGKYGWRKFALRPQDTLERWEIDRYEGDVHGMHQVDWYTGRRAYIPFDRAINFRTDTYKNNPEGRSILRNAVIYYYYLKRICEIEAIGIERDMAGLLVMEVPQELISINATAEAVALRDQLRKMLSLLKRGEMEYAMIPPSVGPDSNPTGYKLRLLSSGGSRQIDTTAVKQYYKTSIMQTVLAQFIDLGTVSTASLALATSHTNTFAIALGAFMDTISETFTSDAIGPLMKANGIHPHNWPSLHHGDLDTPPLNEVGTYVQALSSVGMLPETEALRRKLLDYAKLPIPDEGVVESELMFKSRSNRGLRSRYLHHGHGGCSHSKTTLRITE